MATRQQRQKTANEAPSLSQSFRSFYDISDDMSIDPESISKIKNLGEGSFASVDLCSWEGKRVAVKTLKSELLSSERDLMDFLHEAALLKKMSHEAIVNFVGVAIGIETTPSSKQQLFHSSSSISRRAWNELSKLMRLKTAKSPNENQLGLSTEKRETRGEENAITLSRLTKKVMIVQEYMSRGTLKQLVIKQMGSPFKMLYTKGQGLEWLIQIAKGLMYLHSSRPIVIHRDLKLENIMLTVDVDGEIIAKLGDFGLHAILKDPKQLAMNKPSFERLDSLTLRHSVSQDECLSSIQASYDLSGRTGSMMYMAPEVLHFMPYNEKADVFSFGIIMYEVLCKMLLLTFVCCRGVPEEVENYAQGIALGNRPVVPEDWPESFATLVRQCWAQDPADRPSMNTIVSQLIDLKGDDWIVNECLVKGCSCCAVQ